MNFNKVKDFLYDINLGDKGNPGSLRHLAFVIGEKEYNMAKYAVKEQIVTMLAEYYCAADRFEELWNSLSDADRKIISLHIWGNATEPLSCADEVAKEFGIAMNSKYYYSYSRNGLGRYKSIYAKSNSKLWLLFPKDKDNNGRATIQTPVRTNCHSDS